jgi:zinc protease
MSPRTSTTPPGPGAIRPFDAPAVRRSTLPNGAQVLTAEQPGTGLVTIQVVLDAGAMTEPDGRAGVAHLTTSALDASAGGRDAAALAEAFERLGAQLDASAWWDAASAEVTVAAAQLEPALELLAEVVRAPTFPDAEIERLREEQEAEIMQRGADPGALATDAFARCVFADGSAYARPLLGTIEQVEALQTDDVRSFHAQRFTAGGSAIVLAGAVRHERAFDLAARYFGSWTGSRPGRTAVATEPATSRTLIYVLDRPGSVQSEIRVGHVGVPRSHPDYHAIDVMNSLLGGAFTSRLNMNLRERHGFTYGARSGFAFRRHAGPFVVQAAVATDVTGRAVEEILNELRGLAENGPTEAEVEAARDLIAGVLPLQLQTTEQVTDRISDLFIHDLPDDYLLTVRDAIRAVRIDDVARVAREQLHLDRLAILVVGDAAGMTDQLAALGVGEIVPVAHDEN